MNCRGMSNTPPLQFIAYVVAAGEQTGTNQRRLLRHAQELSNPLQHRERRILLVTRRARTNSAVATSSRGLMIARSVSQATSTSKSSSASVNS